MLKPLFELDNIFSNIIWFREVVGKLLQVLKAISPIVSSNFHWIRYFDFNNVKRVGFYFFLPQIYEQVKDLDGSLTD